MKNELFITTIVLDKNKIEDYSVYPFSIPAVKNFEKLKINKPVTFLIGENGVGKSTFIEAIAVAIGLNPEGGSQNFNFSTKNTHSLLADYIHVYKYNIPKTKFFLRAESFYNVASEIIKISEEGGQGPLYNSYGGNLHECSHGESFIKLVKNRFSDHGLYILDEPESALSPQRQMSLLCLIHELVEKGSQFIIATHSPILVSYINGEIINLDDNFKSIKYEDTEIFKTYQLYLNDPYHMQKLLFQKEIDS